MILCERPIEMCDVIPECFLSVPSLTEIKSLGISTETLGITSHISIGLSQKIVLNQLFLHIQMYAMIPQNIFLSTDCSSSAK